VTATTHNKKKVERVAYSLEEFSRMFGHNRAWGYRMKAAKKIRVIEGFGVTMVPSSEVKRLIEAAADAGAEQ